MYSLGALNVRRHDRTFQKRKRNVEWLKTRINTPYFQCTSMLQTTRMCSTAPEAHCTQHTHQTPPSSGTALLKKLVSHYEAR